MAIEDNLIALTALAISILAFFKDSIKDFLSSKEKKEKHNQANLTTLTANKKLIISNKGLAKATNVRVYIDGEDITENSVFSAKHLDYSIINPGNSVGIEYHVVLNMEKTYFNVQVYWDDKHKKNKIHENIINLI